jgi:hypothetical protein
VLLAFLAFASVVLADPHRGEPYGLRPGYDRPGYDWRRIPGRFYGRPNDPRIIVIIQQSPTTAASVNPAPSTAAPTAAPVSTAAAEPSTEAAVTDG